MAAWAAGPVSPERRRQDVATGAAGASTLTEYFAGDVLCDEKVTPDVGAASSSLPNPFNGGYIELWLELLEHTHDAAWLERAERLARGWSCTEAFEHSGVFCRIESTHSTALAATLEQASTLKARLFKDNTNLVWGILALHQRTGEPRWRRVLSRWLSGFEAHFWNAGNVFLLLDPALRGREPSLKAAFSSIDLLCDFHHAGVEPQRSLALAAAAADFWLTQQWPNGLFPEQPGGGRDDLDANVDLTVALWKLHALTGEDRYRVAATRCRSALLELHAGPYGYGLAVDQAGRVVDRQIISEVPGAHPEARVAAGAFHRNVHEQESARAVEGSMSMKVAYLVGRFPVLSETFVASEIDRLCARGFDIHIYSFAGPPQQDVTQLSPGVRRLLERTRYIGTADVLAAMLSAPASVLRGLQAARGLHGAASMKANAALRLLRAVAIARRLRADGVRHLHAHWPYASQIAHIVRDISGASYSISVHAHEVAHDDGHFPVIFPALSFAAFCNRGAMEHLLPRMPRTARERAHLIYHGVDLEKFEPLPLPESVQPIRVISAGRLTRTKGFDRLIRACATAYEQGIDVHLTVLGRGSLETELRALAADLRFSERLTMPGWVSHENVREHMRRAHVFALLADTSFHDGLPNVALEAMASARPVVLSPLPAAGEAVEDGVEGYVLKAPADVEGFIDVLRRFQNEPELVRSMGQAARRRVERDHDANVQIERMAGLMDRFANA